MLQHLQDKVLLQLICIHSYVKIQSVYQIKISCWEVIYTNVNTDEIWTPFASCLSFSNSWCLALYPASRPFILIYLSSVMSALLFWIKLHKLYNIHVISDHNFFSRWEQSLQKTELFYRNKVIVREGHLKKNNNISPSWKQIEPTKWVTSTHIQWKLFLKNLNAVVDTSLSLLSSQDKRKSVPMIMTLFSVLCFIH